MAEGDIISNSKEIQGLVILIKLKSGNIHSVLIDEKYYQDILNVASLETGTIQVVEQPITGLRMDAH